MNDATRWFPIMVCVVLQTACASSGAIPPGSMAPVSVRAVATSQAGVVATVPDLARLGVRDLGPAPRSTLLSLSITLQYRNRAQLETLVAQQSDPGSSRYRDWLSNAQFDQRFAPTQAAYDDVARSLRAAGFRINGTYDNRTVVDATAPIAAIERFFRTSIHGVAGSSQGAAYINVTPARAPSELKGLVLSVDGLDTVISVHAPHATFARSPSHHVRALLSVSANCQIGWPRE